MSNLNALRDPWPGNTKSNTVLIVVDHFTPILTLLLFVIKNGYFTTILDCGFLFVFLLVVIVL